MTRSNHYRYCLSCAVGGTEDRCWLCDLEMRWGDIRDEIRHREDVSMREAHTAFSPGPVGFIEYKSLDDLIPMLDAKM